MVREEVSWWWNTAKKNLRRGQDAQAGEDYEASTFWSHQAIEYALKAIILHSGALPNKRHNLYTLQEALPTAVKISESERQLLLELGPYYSLSRYPDIYGGEPKVHSETSKRFVKFAEDLLEKLEPFLTRHFAKNERSDSSRARPSRVAIAMDYVKKLSTVVRVEKAYIFGSTAKEEELSDSDVDIAIISPDFEGKPVDSRIRLAYSLWTYRVPADILLLTPREKKSLLTRSVILRDASRYWKPLPIKH